MGGPGSGRRPAETAPTRAGLLLLAWAREQKPGAFVRLAEAAGVSPRTVSRWIVAPPGSPWEPRISQAVTCKRVAGVPLGAWTEPVTPT